MFNQSNFRLICLRLSSPLWLLKNINSKRYRRENFFLAQSVWNRDGDLKKKCLRLEILPAFADDLILERGL